jgi:hypothetical protein
MISEVESNLVESRHQSGGPILAAMGSVARAADGLKQHAPVSTPLSRLKKDAHADCGEGPQSKPGEVGTIAAPDTGAGCVGGSLCFLDSATFGGVVRPGDADVNADASCTCEKDHSDLGGAAHRQLTGSEDPVGLSESRSALISVPAAGMRPADSHYPGETHRGPQAVSAHAVLECGASEEISGGLSGADVPDSAHGTNGAGAEIETLDEGGVGMPPEEARITEANRRKGILETFDSLLQQGHSKAAAAKEVATGYATIWRWEKAYREKGFSGLIPDTAKCGRMTIWEKLGISDEERQQILNELKGLNLDTDSVTTSLRIFARTDKCRPDLAEVILNPNRSSKHALPPSLRKAVEVNSNLKKAHRGPRALSLGGIWTPRALDILPGDIFTSDDTTPIWAWWIPWQESEEYPFGVKLLQGQFIPIMDVASQCILTYVLIAREKSSYRASDIWYLFGHTFDMVGFPRLGWQLERGSWEANIIRGAEVEYRENEISFDRRIGGLRQLPTNITKWHEEKLQGVPFPKTLQTWTSFLPKSKSIEAWFNRNQTLEGTLWGSLGRSQMREPFEKAKQLFQQCSRPGAKLDPRNYFLSGTEIATRLNAMVSYINEEPMEGEVFNGIPIQKFEQARKDYPLLTTAMPPMDELTYLYRREWSLQTITQGWARVRLTDNVSGSRYSLFYINPEVFAQIEGKQVAVYYDREEFEKPAQIIAASSFEINGRRFEPGEFVCHAEYQDRKGSFLGGETGHDIRKRWKNAVMSVYGTLVKHAPSRQLPPEIAARREESKSAQRASAPAPAPAQTVDRRPAAVVLPASRNSGPTPDDIQKQRNRISQQAAIAARLRALRGEE